MVNPHILYENIARNGGIAHFQTQLQYATRCFRISKQIVWNQAAFPGWREVDPSQLAEPRRRRSGECAKNPRKA